MFSKKEKKWCWIYSFAGVGLVFLTWAIVQLATNKLPVADSVKWRENSVYILPFVVPRYWDAILFFITPWVYLYFKNGLQRLKELLPENRQHKFNIDKSTILWGGLSAGMLAILFVVLGAGMVIVPVVGLSSLLSGGLLCTSLFVGIGCSMAAVLLVSLGAGLNLGLVAGLIPFLPALILSFCLLKFYIYLAEKPSLVTGIPKSY